MGDDPPENNLKRTSESLFEQLNKRVRALDDRERELAKREELVKAALKGTQTSDVLPLNVGGRTGIAVFRSTLTTFEDSLLAAQFSGRWDDSLAKDKDGNFFIDQDPDLFQELLSFLRSKNNDSPDASAPVLPKLTPSMDRLLEHYNLTHCIFPFETVPYKPYRGIEVKKNSSSSFSVESREAKSVFFVKAFGHNRTIVSFTITVGKYSALKVGWDQNYVQGHPFYDDNQHMALLDVVRGETWNGADAQHCEQALFPAVEGTVFRFDRKLTSWTWTVLGDNSRPVHLDTSFSFIAEALPVIFLRGDVQISDVKYRKLRGVLCEGRTGDFRRYYT